MSQTGSQAMLDPTAHLVLRAHSLRKRYGAVVALADGSIELRAGEVMALMGDNGAGKSTLIKCLSGVVEPDGGEILIDGTSVEMAGPADALAIGIETVYQDLALVDSMSARENIYLGRELIRTSGIPRVLRIVDRRGMATGAREVVDRIGATVPNLELTVEQMSGGQRQALAIARAVLWGHRIVILDEPTAALGVREASQVLDIIRALKNEGVSVIMISHNLEHVFEVADRVTVLRLGSTVGVLSIDEATADDVVTHITGSHIP